MPTEHLKSITIHKTMHIVLGSRIKTKTGRIAWVVEDIYRFNRGVIWVLLRNDRGQARTIKAEQIGVLLP